MGPLASTIEGCCYGVRRCRERLTELAIEVKRGADNAALLRGLLRWQGPYICCRHAGLHGCGRVFVDASMQEGDPKVNQIFKEITDCKFKE